MNRYHRSSEALTLDLNGIRSAPFLISTEVSKRALVSSTRFPAVLLFHGGRLFCFIGTISRASKRALEEMGVKIEEAEQSKFQAKQNQTCNGRFKEIRCPDHSSGRCNLVRPNWSWCFPHVNTVTVSPGRTVPSSSTMVKNPSRGMTQSPTCWRMAQWAWHSFPSWVTSSRTSPTRSRVPTGRV